MSPRPSKRADEVRVERIDQVPTNVGRVGKGHGRAGGCDRDTKKMPRRYAILLPAHMDRDDARSPRALALARVVRPPNQSGQMVGGCLVACAVRRRFMSRVRALAHGAKSPSRQVRCSQELQCRGVWIQSSDCSFACPLAGAPLLGSGVVANAGPVGSSFLNALCGVVFAHRFVLKGARSGVSRRQGALFCGLSWGGRGACYRACTRMLAQGRAQASVHRAAGS